MLQIIKAYSYKARREPSFNSKCSRCWHASLANDALLHTRRSCHNLARLGAAKIATLLRLSSRGREIAQLDVVPLQFK